MRIYEQKHTPSEDDVLIPVDEWTKELQGQGFWPSAGSAYWYKDGFRNTTDDPFNYDSQDATHVIWFDK